MPLGGGAARRLCCYNWWCYPSAGVGIMGRAVGFPDGVLPLSPKMLSLHKCKHGAQRCVRCFWRSKGKAWQRRHIIQGTRIPWLSAGWNREQQRCGLGCVPCAMLTGPLKGLSSSATAGDGYASFMVMPKAGKFNSSHLNRHEKTRKHQEAVKQWVARHLTARRGADSNSIWPPPREEFEECLSKLRKGRSARDGEGASDKTSLMRWCLSEAMLQEARQHVREALTIVLVRDERHGRLLLRYRTCSPDMCTAAGVFGLERLPAGAAENLLDATKKAVISFATPRLAPPRNVRVEAGGVNRRLVQHIRSHVHIVVTDCAASELLAQAQARGQRQPYDAGARRLLGDGSSFLPNIKLIGRDRAHAAQRFLGQGDAQMLKGTSRGERARDRDMERG